MNDMGTINGQGSVIAVLFIILIIWAIFGRNAHADEGHGHDGCNRVSNCEVQKQEIIDNARNQREVIEQNNATREAIRLDGEKTREQNSRIYEAGLQEKIFDLKAENQALKTQMHSDYRFNALERQIERFDCATPKRPPFYSCGGYQEIESICS